MIADGELGDIRVVQVEYAQDWLATPVEETGAKQADWRTDPAQSGAGGSTGDIGTHAYNLACFVTGLTLESLAADLQAFVPGRRLDDNAHVLLRFEGGARGHALVQPGRRPATRTRCASASTATRAGSNGRRRTRTTSGSRRSASRSG